MRTPAQQKQIWIPSGRRRNAPKRAAHQPNESTLTPSEHEQVLKVLEDYAPFRATLKDPPRIAVQRRGFKFIKVAPLRRRPKPPPEKLAAEQRAEMLRAKIAQGEA